MNIRFMILLFFYTMVVSGQPKPFVKFNPSTLEQYYYPGATFDADHTEWLTGYLRQYYPNIHIVQVISMMTTAPLNAVVAHYAILSGRLCCKEGERFVYVFSHRNEKPTSRVEIYQNPVPRLRRECWPVRVNIIYLEFPLTAPSNVLNRPLLKIRQNLESLYFEGKLREDIAAIKMSELGPDAEVIVIETDDPFEKVYSFFRSRSRRRIYIIQARSETGYMRDFEFDASHIISGRKKDKVLIIRVDENPTITDSQGSAQIFNGHIFIQYIFWPHKKSLIPDSLNHTPDDEAVP
jgi:hypothetical protein